MTRDFQAPDIASLYRFKLERVLGTRVKIVEKNEKRGHIEIEYYSQEDLHRIYSQIVGESEAVA